MMKIYPKIFWPKWSFVKSIPGLKGLVIGTDLVVRRGDLVQLIAHVLQRVHLLLEEAA
jgi:hypothetical protein